MAVRSKPASAGQHPTIEQSSNLTQLQLLMDLCNLKTLSLNCRLGLLATISDLFSEYHFFLIAQQTLFGWQCVFS